jgi:hypothetical protein
MKAEFNANVKLLMGGLYCGSSSWNKEASEIDRCFKMYFLRSGEVQLSAEDDVFALEEGRFYFINGYALRSQSCLQEMAVDWLHFQPESVYFNHMLKQAPCALELNRPGLPQAFSFQENLEPFFKNRLDDAQNRSVQLELIALIHFTIATVFREMHADLFEET